MSFNVPQHSSWLEVGAERSSYLQKMPRTAPALGLNWTGSFAFVELTEFPAITST